jgi:hypothetical protein
MIRRRQPALRGSRPDMPPSGWPPEAAQAVHGLSCSLPEAKDMRRLSDKSIIFEFSRMNIRGFGAWPIRVSGRKISRMF